MLLLQRCCCAAADLERGDDAAVDGGVRDLVLAEGAVCEDGGDGVPFARDLCCLGIIESVCGGLCERESSENCLWLVVVMALQQTRTCSR